MRINTIPILYFAITTRPIFMILDFQIRGSGKIKNNENSVFCDHDPRDPAIIAIIDIFRCEDNRGMKE